MAVCCIALVDLSGTLGLSAFSMRSGCVTCCRSGLPPSSSEEPHCVTLPHWQCCSACSSVIRPARLLQYAGTHAQCAHARVQLLLLQHFSSTPAMLRCMQSKTATAALASQGKFVHTYSCKQDDMRHSQAASGQRAHCCLKCSLDHCSGQRSLPHGKSADDQLVRSLENGLVQGRQLSVVSSVRLTQALSKSCRGEQRSTAPQRFRCGSCL